MLANGVLHFDQEFVEDLLLGGDFFLQFEKRFGFEIAKREIFEFAANEAHAEPIGDRRVDVERFAGDALLAFGVEIFERAHVVQAIGQLDQHHAHVVDHGQKHLANVLGLARFGSEQIEAADLRDAFDQAGHVGTKFGGKLFESDFRVFDDVVKDRGAERGRVELHIRQEMGDFNRMGEIGFARKADLAVMMFGGEIVGAAKEVEIVARAILANLVDQLDEAQVNRPPCGGDALVELGRASIKKVARD